MQLTIGSSRPISTDGGILIRGRQQILLEWGRSKTALLLTMNLYGPAGQHVARLRRNEWTFNDYDRFDLMAQARSFQLVDLRLNLVVLAGRVAGRDAVVITDGTFYSSDGHQMEISMEHGNGVTDSGTSTESSARSTLRPFAADEVAFIREAGASSPAAIACPRCGQPLTRHPLMQLKSLLVSCTVCRGNLVIPQRS